MILSGSVSVRLSGYDGNVSGGCVCLCLRRLPRVSVGGSSCVYEAVSEHVCACVRVCVCDCV